jgi:hypothetical protein
MEFQAGDKTFSRTLRQTTRGHLMLDIADATTGIKDTVSERLEVTG